MPGSQTFAFGKSLPVIQRVPRTIAAFRRVLGDVGVSPRYRNNQASTLRSRKSTSVSVFRFGPPRYLVPLQVTSLVRDVTYSGAERKNAAPGVPGSGVWN